MVRAWRAAAVLLLNTLLLLIAAEGLAAAWVWWTAPRPATPLNAAGRAAEVLSDDGDRLTVDYWPHVGWRAHPLTSETVNVDEGGNRVTPGQDCGPGAFTVFVFGGSTVFGYGVADADTVPAQIQRQLAVRHQGPTCVRNLGQFGWSSTHSVIALVRELQERPAPDLVVFYDGFNEVNLLGDDGVAGGPPRGTPEYDGAIAVARAARHGAATALLELLRSTHLHEVVGPWGLGSPEPTDESDPPVSPEAIVRAYLANVDSVRGIARAHGFRAAFFWQPTLWVKRGPRTPEEEQVLADSPVRAGAPRLLQATYPLIAAEAARRPDLFYLGAIFDEVTTPTPYLDECHLTPAGNAVAAAHVVRRLAGSGLLPETASQDANPR